MKGAAVSFLVRLLSAEVTITTGTRFVIMLSGIVTAIVTARVLGPEGRGLYFYSVTIAGFVTQLGNLGFSSSNTYIVARQTERLSALAVNSILLSAAVLLVFGLMLAALSSMGKGPILIFMLSALLGAANLLLMLLSNLLVGLRRIIAFNIFQLTYNLVLMVAIVTAAFANGDVYMFLVASLLVTALFAILTFTVLLRGISFRFRFDTDVFRMAIGYSFRAFLVTLLGYAIARGNVLLLERFADREQLGFYSVAVQIADVIAIFPISVALVVFPRLVRQDKDHRYASALRQARAVGILTFLICCLAALLADPFVRLAFGEPYLASVRVLYALLPGSLFLGVSTILTNYLASEGIPRRTLTAWICTALCFCLATTYFVPSYQAIGAAVALSITYASLLAFISVAAAMQARHEQEAK